MKEEKTYQERFNELKKHYNYLKLEERAGNPYEEGISHIETQFKALQDEIKANGCGEYAGHDEYGNDWYCVAGVNCPTCQNLIKQIEELLE